MYFILSKVLLFLLFPVLWVLGLLIAGLLTKKPKRKKRFLIASLLVLYIFSAPLFLNLFARAWSVEPFLAKEPKFYSCAIVLGGFSGPDKNNKGYFNGSADRFIQGIKMLTTGRATHLLITGGNGSLFPGQFTEGEWVKTQLNALKIPDSCVLIEGRSRNTIENAVFSKALLQKAGLQPPYLLITSDFHMRRAYMIFKKEGYSYITPYPCNFMAGNTGDSFYDLIPEGGTLAGWEIYLKEVVGYVVDKWK